MDLRNESGYTLIETLVAMTIFVGVLIPIASAIGNALLFADKSNERRALIMAHSELTRRLDEAVIGDNEFEQEGYEIKSSCSRDKRLLQVTVRITKSRVIKSELVVHKTMLAE